MMMQKPYIVFDQIEILEQTNQLSAALTSLLTSVALISLLVGSIGNNEYHAGDSC